MYLAINTFITSNKIALATSSFHFIELFIRYSKVSCKPESNFRIAISHKKKLLNKNVRCLLIELFNYKSFHLALVNLRFQKLLKNY